MSTEGKHRGPSLSERWDAGLAAIWGWIGAMVAVWALLPAMDGNIGGAGMMVTFSLMSLLFGHLLNGDPDAH